MSMEAWRAPWEGDVLLTPFEPLSPTDDNAKKQAEPPNEVAHQEADTSPLQPGDPNGPVPDGGLKAWLQVLGSFMLFFNSWGVLNSYGVFQTYYESGQLFVNTSSNIAWIGSIQAFLLLVTGVLAGPFYDRGYFRTIMLVGSFMVIFGHMMLSLCTTYWQVLLAQAFFVGIGIGCLFLSGVAIMSSYFSKKIGLVLGICASGSSLGGVIYPIVFYKLVDKVGFGWSVRVLGFIMLATLIIPIVCMQMRVKPARIRSLMDWSAFVDVPYMTFALVALIGFAGLYVMFFYLSFYGEITGITNASLSFYLVPLINAGSVLGRLLPNVLADTIGPLNVMCPGLIIVVVHIFCMLAVHNIGGIVVMALSFGFFSGIFIALPSMVFITLTKDKSKVGTRIGMGYAMASFGTLIGGPGGGDVLGTNIKDLHWTRIWIFGACCVTAATILCFLVRYMKGGFKIMVKV